ncbi:MAG: hypothetical protein KY391_00255 [Actinobacteria bacterium]|nr:hypothetical protein [Actinomycetota bacterium]
MRKWLIVVSIATALVATGCSSNPGEDDHVACAESLDREQQEVGTRAVGEVATAAGIIDGALDGASNRRLQPRDEKSLRAAQRRLERLEQDLDQAFNTGCL